MSMMDCMQHLAATAPFFLALALAERLRLDRSTVVYHAWAHSHSPSHPHIVQVGTSGDFCRELRFEHSRASTHDETKAGSCASTLPRLDARRYKGRVLRFEHSRAPTHDETKAGSCTSSSPMPRCTTIQRPGAALRALPRLDARRDKGRELRFELSRASTPLARRDQGRGCASCFFRAATMQRPGATPRALPRLDDTKAGSNASCSPAPRSRSHDEIKAGSCISYPPVPRRRSHDETKAGRSASCCPAPRRRPRTTSQRPGVALRALPRPDDTRPRQRCMHDASEDIVNTPAGSEVPVLDSL
ncbi:hypothetical protein B0H13DRAFT_2349473 [Mycena leptocephala]|nr:hypothetical protein B0H13DRAFT_2349473 [Mycena leptocephala]